MKSVFFFITTSTQVVCTPEGQTLHHPGLNVFYTFLLPPGVCNNSSTHESKRCVVPD